MHAFDEEKYFLFNQYGAVEKMTVKKSKTPVEEIYRYYQSLESKWGYSLIMHDSKHLGYYPSRVATISERTAQRLYERVIARALGLRKGDKVLDAGCGRGVVACYLAQQYHVAVTGVDIIDFEIASARRRAVREHVNSMVRFEIMDYSQLAFPARTFDAVYANETMSHAPNLAKVLKEFIKILKPGGSFAFIEYVLAEPSRFNQEEIETVRFVARNSAMVGLEQFRVKNIFALLAAAGFENVKARNITAYCKPSFYRLYKIARPFYPIIRILGLRKKFINATAAFTYYPLVQKGLISLYVFSGCKKS